MIGSIAFFTYALILSIRGSLPGRKLFLALSLGVLFVFLSIRYDFGNDIPAYRHSFEVLGGETWGRILTERMEYSERGYLVLNKLFSRIGFNAMLTVCAAALAIAYYRTILRTTTESQYTFALFLLLFDPYIVLVQSSAVRQTIAISIFLLSLPLLFKRKLFWYVLACLFACQFHLTALVLIPVYFFLSPKECKPSFLLSLVLVYVILTFFGSKLIGSFFNAILTQVDMKYLDFRRLEVSKVNSGFGTLAKGGFLCIVAWYSRGLGGYRAIAIKGAILSAIVGAFSVGFPLAGRLGMYFDPFLAMALPIAISRISNGNFRFAVIFAYGAFVIRGFFLFFSNPTWADSFARFKTIWG